MDTLPMELIAAITDCLNIRDAFRLGTTCWAYYDLTCTLCAHRIQRDWLTHRTQMRGVFDAINNGYYVMINNDGVRSYKVIDQHFFMYFVASDADYSVRMRISADNSRRAVYKLIWRLYGCDDGGYYLKYHTIVLYPDLCKVSRIVDIDAFARNVITLNGGKQPERY